VLLGDSAHAMQPNLGQGGCMAIEDAYQLVLDLCQEADRVEGEAAQGRPAAMDVERVLTGYTLVRRRRLLSPPPPPAACWLAGPCPSAPCLSPRKPRSCRRAGCC
jgi:hypothetical protein